MVDYQPDLIIEGTGRNVFERTSLVEALKVEKQKTVKAGRITLSGIPDVPYPVTFNIKLYNSGTKTDTITISEYKELPPNWSVTYKLDGTTVTLPTTKSLSSDSSAFIMAIITIPKDENCGVVGTVRVCASSSSQPDTNRDEVECCLVSNFATLSNIEVEAELLTKDESIFPSGITQSSPVVINSWIDWECSSLARWLTPAFFEGFSFKEMELAKSIIINKCVVRLLQRASASSFGNEMAYDRLILRYGQLNATLLAELESKCSLIGKGEDD